MCLPVCRVCVSTSGKLRVLRVLFSTLRLVCVSVWIVLAAKPFVMHFH